MRAVVFDLDGVLIDSEPVWRDVEAEVARELGFRYSEELATQLHGRGPVAVAEIVGELTGDPGVGRRAAGLMVERMLERGAAGRIPQMPGARELVEELRPVVRLAVASNSVRRYVEGSLAGAGLDGCFDAVIAGDEVERAKPEPDAYLRAAERLGVPPSACVAIEDSPAGVESARRAGMRVLAVAGLGGDPGIPAVGSLRELTAERILAAP